MTISFYPYWIAECYTCNDLFISISVRVHVTCIFYFTAYSGSQHTPNPWLLLVIKIKDTGWRKHSRSPSHSFCDQMLRSSTSFPGLSGYFSKFWENTQNTSEIRLNDVWTPVFRHLQARASRGLPPHLHVHSPLTSISIVHFTVPER